MNNFNQISKIYTKGSIINLPIGLASYILKDYLIEEYININNIELGVQNNIINNINVTRSKNVNININITNKNNLDANLSIPIVVAKININNNTMLQFLWPKINGNISNSPFSARNANTMAILIAKQLAVKYNVSPYCIINPNRESINSIRTIPNKFLSKPVNVYYNDPSTVYERLNFKFNNKTNIVNTNCLPIDFNVFKHPNYQLGCGLYFKDILFKQTNFIYDEKLTYNKFMINYHRNRIC